MTDVLPAPCTAWRAPRATRAGGILAEAFLLDPAKASYLIYPPGFDPLPLLAEATLLLPPRLRWYVTFNTYFTELPAGLICAWRCAVADTPAAKDARRYATSGIVIDLSRPLEAVPQRLAAQHAREGKILTVRRSIVRHAALETSRNAHDRGQRAAFAQTGARRDRM